LIINGEHFDQIIIKVRGTDELIAVISDKEIITKEEYVIVVDPAPSREERLV
jgi:hypothetical protein